jgi:hypothetical protein
MTSCSVSARATSRTSVDVSPTRPASSLLSDRSVPSVNHSSWASRNARTHSGSSRSVLARSMANSTAFDP